MAKELFFEPFLAALPGSALASHNRSELRISLRQGGTIWCKSADNPDALLGRGLTYVIVDEFQSMPANIFEAYFEPLIAETPDKPKGKVLILGTPRGQGHPFHQIWVRGQRGTGKHIGWKSWLLTAYEAKMVPEEQINAMRDAALARGRTAYKIWQREWMADWKAFVGQVFEAWDESRMVVQELPKFVRIVGGLDFGFSESHPGALVLWGMDAERNWYAIDEVYAAGQTVNTFWLPKIKALATTYYPKMDTLWCDPARPDHIFDIRRTSGDMWTTREANNDVWSGIVEIATLMEKNKFRVHARCENLIRELPSYQWEQTSEGMFKERPKKVLDHAIDASRYALASESLMPQIGMR